MTDRQPISKKVRFEIFKRDSFTCQYCGIKAPDVVLHIDHIAPVSKGGTNDILNLITSCKDCNSGKSNRELTDDSVIEKQRRQLDDLQEKKEQLEMMFNWQKGLLDIESGTVAMLAEYWGELVSGYNLNKNGERGLKKLINKFSMDEIMEAMKISADQYIKYYDGDITPDSVEVAWKKVGGVCSCRRKGYNPEMNQMYYIRGILRNRVFVNEKYIIPLLKRAYQVGVDMDIVTEYAKNCKNWTIFREFVEDETESIEAA